MKKNQNNISLFSSVKGITLIALIITVIVIIILSAMVIRGTYMLVNRAGQAATYHEIAVVQDKVIITREFAKYGYISELPGDRLTRQAEYDDGGLSSKAIGGVLYSGKDWYYISSKDDFVQLGIQNTNNKFIVNYVTGSVISENGYISENGDTLYVLEYKETLKAKQVLLYCGFKMLVVFEDGTLYEKNSGDVSFVKLNISDVDSVEYGAGYFVVKKDGTVWVKGANTNGSLGLGSTASVSDFTKIESLSNIKKVIHTSTNNTLYLSNDGKIYGSGRNGYGELALGNYSTTSTPQYNSDIFNTCGNIKDIDCAREVVGYAPGAFLLLAEDGKVYFTGAKYSGNMGDGTSAYKAYNTVQTVPITDVAKIEVADRYNASLFIKNDGTFWACGYNYNGNFGLGAAKVNKVITTPTKCLELADGEKIVEVGSDGGDTILITDRGNMYGVGINTNGRLGMGNRTALNTFTKIETAISPATIEINNTSAILKDIFDNIWITGLNEDNIFAVGDDSSSVNTYKKVGNFGLTKDISMRAGSIAIVKDDGTVIVRGNNEFGQLGLGHKNEVSEWTAVPDLSDIVDVEVGGFYASGLPRSISYISSTGKVYSAGNNDAGDLGINSTTSSSVVREMNGITNALRISKTGRYGTAILCQDNKLYFTGFSHNLVWPGVYNVPTAISGHTTAIDVSIGQQFACLIAGDGKAYAAGYNTYGQIGNGTTTNSVKVFAEVTSKPADKTFVRCYTTPYGASTFYLTSDGEVYATGNNSAGQLGIGNTTNQANLQKVLINNVVDVKLGDSHTVFIKNDGTVWVCGGNVSGQLGLGHYDSVSTPTKIDSIKNIKKAYAGGDNTILVDTNDDIYMCGDNSTDVIGIDSFHVLTMFMKASFEI